MYNVYIIIYVCILAKINNICTEIEAMIISYDVPYIVYRNYDMFYGQVMQTIVLSGKHIFVNNQIEIPTHVS